MLKYGALCLLISCIPVIGMDRFPYAPQSKKTDTIKPNLADQGDTVLTTYTTFLNTKDKKGNTYLHNLIIEWPRIILEKSVKEKIEETTGYCSKKLFKYPDIKMVIEEELTRYEKTLSPLTFKDVMVDVFAVDLPFISNVNEANNKGETLLFLACKKIKYSPIVKLLLEAGANPNQVTKKEITPLEKACQQELNAETIMLLMDHGATLSDEKFSNLIKRTAVQSIINKNTLIRALVKRRDISTIKN